MVVKKFSRKNDKKISSIFVEVVSHSKHETHNPLAVIIPPILTVLHLYFDIFTVSNGDPVLYPLY